MQPTITLSSHGLLAAAGALYRAVPDGQYTVGARKNPRLLPSSSSSSPPLNTSTTPLYPAAQLHTVFPGSRLHCLGRIVSSCVVYWQEDAQFVRLPGAGQQGGEAPSMGKESD